MYKIKRILFSITTTLLISLVAFTITGCEPTTNETPSEEIPPEKDEFTIRVFDIVSGEERKDGKRYYYDYTGEIIDMEIKVYCNGEEMHTTSISYLNENQGPGSLVTVRTRYKKSTISETKQQRISPLERGWYYFDIEFNRNYWWNGNTLHEAIVNDFYFHLFIDYEYFMSGGEE